MGALHIESLCSFASHDEVADHALLELRLLPTARGWGQLQRLTEVVGDQFGLVARSIDRDRLDPLCDGSVSFAARRPRDLL